MFGLESALEALQITAAKTPIPNCTRCLADTEDHRRCIRPAVPDVTKMTKFKSLDDCIMDCLCKTHKYHLERQVGTKRPRWRLANYIITARNHHRALSTIAARQYGQGGQARTSIPYANRSHCGHFHPTSESTACTGSEQDGETEA